MTSSQIEDGLSEDQTTLVAKLKELFATRPIWAKAKLATNFTAEQLASVMDLLGRVAYRYACDLVAFSCVGYGPARQGCLQARLRCTP